MIAPDQPLSLWAVILTGVAFTMWLERRFGWAQWVGGPTLGLLIAACLSNVRVMPTESPAYEFSSVFILPAAIALLLLHANLAQIVSKARGLLVAFLLCCLGTVAGAAIAYLLLRAWLPHSAEIAGIEAASNIGGSVNFAAVRDTFGLDATTTSALLVADNLVMVSAFVVLFWAAGNPWVRRLFQAQPSATPKGESERKEPVSTDPFDSEARVKDLAAGFAIALSFAAIADVTGCWIRSWVVEAVHPSLRSLGLDQVIGNRYVLVSLLSVTAATCFRSAFSQLRGIRSVGTYLLYIYLFTLGFPADISAVLGRAPLLFLFCFIVSYANLVFALALGRVFRVRFEPLLLTINATVGGPSTAAAMAGSCRWPQLVLPAILVGLLGYAVATPIGIIVGRWLMTLRAP